MMATSAVNGGGDGGESQCVTATSGTMTVVDDATVGGVCDKDADKRIGELRAIDYGGSIEPIADKPGTVSYGTPNGDIPHPESVEPNTSGEEDDDDGGDGTVEGEKLQIMQSVEDPLLQETINALMNGTGGIEVVNNAQNVSGEELESERNHECTYCGKLFTRSNTLAYHLKVHTGERPFKCKHCAKAFREQYRLMKHLKTHLKDGSCRDREQGQESPTAGGTATGPEEDYATGDSERFFKSYDLPEGSAAMKLEPDISLTVEGAAESETSAASTSAVPLEAPSENDVRYQIIEERIKSLQREVHLVNQNLNRVETKLDGLTKIISIFIGKFEEEECSTGSVNGQQVVPVNSGSGAMISSPVAASVVSPQPKSVLLATTAQQAQSSVIGVISSVTGHQAVAPMKDTSYHQFQTFAEAPATQPMAPTSVRTVHSSNGTTNILLDTFPEVPELPIRTVNDFLDLNDHCTDNEQFLLQMMIRLHQEIDNSQPFQRNVKKMMEALVTYEVLCQFSWSGKSAINGQYTKYVFGNSVGIIDLLMKTLNLGKSGEEAEANHKPIFAAIQSFIKHSRQNMLRDSRKRREPMLYDANGYRCLIEPQQKQIKAECKVEVSNQF